MTEHPDLMEPLRAEDPATRPEAGGANGAEPGRWRGVSRRYVTVSLISLGTWAVILLAATGWPVLLKVIGPFEGTSWWWLLPWPATVVVVFGALMVTTPRRVRARCYREDAEEFLVRKGLWFRNLVVIPYGRMQYVDVTSGPLLRAFGLAAITMHTASPQTDATLPGISAEEAGRLREHLTERGEDRLIEL